MAMRPFPTDVIPTSRTYKPGKFPETKFEARNGAVSFVQYGQNFVNAELTLNFANINDGRAMQILQHYAEVLGDDYVTFDSNAGFQGMNDELIVGLQDGTGILRWRYSDAPEITSVYPGVSTVNAKFVGVLYGA
jgi:hypothetical protein